MCKITSIFLSLLSSLALLNNAAAADILIASDNSVVVGTKLTATKLTEHAR
jgi:hypothetical protein